MQRSKIHFTLTDNILTKFRINSTHLLQLFNKIFANFNNYIEICHQAVDKRTVACLSGISITLPTCYNLCSF